MLESPSQSSSGWRSKNRTCQGLKMHCKQRSYLRAQPSMAIQIARKGLIISIVVEGNGGSLLGVPGNSPQTGKPPGGWEERHFQGTDPDYAPRIIITFVLTLLLPRRKESQEERRQSLEGIKKFFPLLQHVDLLNISSATPWDVGLVRVFIFSKSECGTSSK